MDRDRLQVTVRQFINEIENGGADEGIINNYIRIIEFLAPGSHFTDLFFYSERDRSLDELIEEIEIRSDIFSKIGKDGVDNHIVNNIKNELSNTDSITNNTRASFAILLRKSPRYAEEVRKIFMNKGLV